MEKRLCGQVYGYVYVHGEGRDEVVSVEFVDLTEKYARRTRDGRLLP